MSWPPMPSGFEKICPTWERFVEICHEEGVTNESEVRGLAIGFLQVTKEVIDEVAEMADGRVDDLPPEAIAELRESTENDIRIAVHESRRLRNN